MEIAVTRANFLKAMGVVGGVTAQKANTLPILGNVLLETGKDSTLRLVGTDLEVGLLLHFGPRAAFKRFAYANERKAISAH